MDDETAPLDRRVVTVILLGTLVVALAPEAAAVVDPFRWFTTLLHEAGHAIATVLVGGRVEALTISPGGGGVTWSLVPDSVWARTVVASAGYLGSIFVGASLLAATVRFRSGQAVMLVLAFAVAGVAVAWVPWNSAYLEPSAEVAAAAGTAQGDSRFTWLFAIVLTASLAALALLTPPRIRQVSLVGLAGLLCWSALGDLVTLVGVSLGRRGHSDAEVLADVTAVPASVWAVLWSVAAVGSVVMAMRTVLER